MACEGAGEGAGAKTDPVCCCRTGEQDSGRHPGDAGGFGQDAIIGFAALNDLERIALSAVTNITDFVNLAANHLTQNGAHAVITDGAGTITLLNVQTANLDANDFLF